jgi:hypothetical protein
MEKAGKLGVLDNRFLHYTRIYPSTNEDHALVDATMKNIRGLFYKLCGVRDKSILSSGNFEKLAKVIKIDRTSLNLMFQKMSGNQKHMGLIEFIDLVTVL